MTIPLVIMSLSAYQKGMVIIMRGSDVINAMELSALAYRNAQPIPLRGSLSVIDDPESGVQCYIRKYGDMLCITFRGSDSGRDWKTNLAFSKQTVPYGNAASPIRVHSGFISAYKSPRVRGVIHGMMSPDIRRVRVMGHSLGAALAALCALDLEYNFPDRDYEALLFGAPRIGNGAFKKSYNKRVPKTLRVENGNDIVTKLPLSVMGYRHAGALLHIGPPRIFCALSAQDHYPHAYYGNLFSKRLT